MTHARTLAELAEVTMRGFDALFDGISTVAWTDFPEHPNVGDSAIYAGELAYCRRTGIRVAYVSSMFQHNRTTLRRRLRTEGSAVAIHGGGNLGGLYEHHHRMRLKLLQEHDDLPVIHAPQSVHFASEQAELELRAAFRSNSRVAVRDVPSRERLRQRLGIDSTLVPDAVHLLGRVAAPPATQDVVVLQRQDGETASARPVPDAEDWLEEPAAPRAEQLVRGLIRRFPTLAGLNREMTPEMAEDRATCRLQRGVAQLARGRVLATDRLHAMLLGIHIQRPVFVADNRIGKLRAYYDTWLTQLDAEIHWCHSIEEAAQLAQDLARTR